MPRQLIGIVGRAGAGKTTAAEYLVKRYGFTRLSYAAPIKNIAKHYFGVTQEEITNKGHDARRILQSLGELLIGIDPDWLIKCMIGSILDTDGDIVIDDIRRENEAELLRMNGGTIVRLVCQGAPEILTDEQKAHTTEKGSDNIQEDIAITEAYGNLEGLRHHMDNLAAFITPSQIKTIAWKPTPEEGAEDAEETGAGSAGSEGTATDPEERRI